MERRYDYLCLSCIWNRTGRDRRSRPNHQNREMNPLRIAFFTNYYHPVVNGVVRSVASFRETLMKQGHNVFIFAQADSSYTDAEPFIFRYPSLPLPGDI